MEVHQVVHNPTLEVVLYLIDNDLLSDIDELNVRKIALILVYCLVNLLVVANAVAEVCCSLLGVLANIVW